MTFARKLEAIIEDLEQMREDAGDIGAIAISHKVTEALAPLINALGSARRIG